MENFNAYNPTSLHFGKNVCRKLPEILKTYGRRILFIYGKGSVIQNGIYNELMSLLDHAGFEITEFSGIKPNPVIEDIENAVRMGIKEKSDMILAVGGGSVIDSAKFVSICIPANFNPWDIVTGIQKPLSFVPLISVLTLAATGTEMNQFAVIQNHNTNEKVGFGSPLMYPKHSFLDPQYTFSVPLNQTAYGISDIIAHAFENFFGIGKSRIADKFAVQIISECMHFAPLVLSEPQNYEYRSNIMMLSTCALNGITVYGKTGGDWAVHSIGHTLSMLFDTPHGASLSIAYPAWFKLMKTRIPEKIKTLSKYLFGNDNIDDFINRMLSFYKSILSPVSLLEVGITPSNREKIFELMKNNKVTGNAHPLSENDYRFLLNEMYGK
jgi:alcohol dehydrogenase YqhD (iron-dependent ADH family)